MRRKDVNVFIILIYIKILIIYMITSTKVAFSLWNFFIPDSDKSEIIYKFALWQKDIQTNTFLLKQQKHYPFHLKRYYTIGGR